MSEEAENQSTLRVMASDTKFIALIALGLVGVLLLIWVGESALGYLVTEVLFPSRFADATAVERQAVGGGALALVSASSLLLLFWYLSAKRRAGGGE